MIYYIRKHSKKILYFFVIFTLIISNINIPLYSATANIQNNIFSHEHVQHFIKAIKQGQLVVPSPDDVNYFEFVIPYQVWEQETYVGHNLLDYKDNARQDIQGIKGQAQWTAEGYWQFVLITHVQMLTFKYRPYKHTQNIPRVTELDKQEGIQELNTKDVRWNSASTEGNEGGSPWENPNKYLTYAQITSVNSVLTTQASDKYTYTVYIHYKIRNTKESKIVMINYNTGQKTIVATLSPQTSLTNGSVSTKVTVPLNVVNNIGVYITSEGKKISNDITLTLKGPVIKYQLHTPIYYTVDKQSTEYTYIIILHYDIQGPQPDVYINNEKITNNITWSSDNKLIINNVKVKTIKKLDIELRKQINNKTYKSNVVSLTLTGPGIQVQTTLQILSITKLNNTTKNIKVRYNWDIKGIPDSLLQQLQIYGLIGGIKSYANGQHWYQTKGFDISRQFKITTAKGTYIYDMPISIYFEHYHPDEGKKAYAVVTGKLSIEGNEYVTHKIVDLLKEQTYDYQTADPNKPTLYSIGYKILPSFTHDNVTDHDVIMTKIYYNWGDYTATKSLTIQFWGHDTIDVPDTYNTILIKYVSSNGELKTLYYKENIYYRGHAHSIKDITITQEQLPADMPNEGILYAIIIPSAGIGNSPFVGDGHVYIKGYKPTTGSDEVSSYRADIAYNVSYAGLYKQDPNANWNYIHYKKPFMLNYEWYAGFLAAHIQFDTTYNVKRDQANISYMILYPSTSQSECTVWQQTVYNHFPFTQCPRIEYEYYLDITRNHSAHVIEGYVPPINAVMQGVWSSEARNKYKTVQWAPFRTWVLADSSDGKNSIIFPWGRPWGIENIKNAYDVSYTFDQNTKKLTVHYNVYGYPSKIIIYRVTNSNSVLVASKNVNSTGTEYFTINEEGKYILSVVPDTQRSVNFTVYYTGRANQWSNSHPINTWTSKTAHWTPNPSEYSKPMLPYIAGFIVGNPDSKAIIHTVDTQQIQVAEDWSEAVYRITVSYDALGDNTMLIINNGEQQQVFSPIPVGKNRTYSFEYSIDKDTQLEILLVSTPDSDKQTVTLQKPQRPNGYVNVSKKLINNNNNQSNYQITVTYNTYGANTQLKMLENNTTLINKTVQTNTEQTLTKNITVPANTKKTIKIIYKNSYDGTIVKNVVLQGPQQNPQLSCSKQNIHYEQGNLVYTYSCNVDNKGLTPVNVYVNDNIRLSNVSNVFNLDVIADTDKTVDVYVKAGVDNEYPGILESNHVHLTVTALKKPSLSVNTQYTTSGDTRVYTITAAVQNLTNNSSSWRDVKIIYTVNNNNIKTLEITEDTTDHVTVEVPVNTTYQYKVLLKGTPNYEGGTETTITEKEGQLEGKQVAPELVLSDNNSYILQDRTEAHVKATLYPHNTTGVVYIKKYKNSSLVSNKSVTYNNTADSLTIANIQETAREGESIQYVFEVHYAGKSYTKSVQINGPPILHIKNITKDDRQGTVTFYFDLKGNILSKTAYRTQEGEQGGNGNGNLEGGLGTPSGSSSPANNNLNATPLVFTNPLTDDIATSPHDVITYNTQKSADYYFSAQYQPLIIDNKNIGPSKTKTLGPITVTFNPQLNKPNLTLNTQAGNKVNYLKVEYSTEGDVTSKIYINNSLQNTISSKSFSTVYQQYKVSCNENSKTFTVTVKRYDKVTGAYIDSTSKSITINPPTNCKQACPAGYSLSLSHDNNTAVASYNAKGVLSDVSIRADTGPHKERYNVTNAGSLSITVNIHPNEYIQIQAKLIPKDPDYDCSKITKIDVLYGPAAPKVRITSFYYQEQDNCKIKVTAKAEVSDWSSYASGILEISSAQGDYSSVSLSSNGGQTSFITSHFNTRTTYHWTAHAVVKYNGNFADDDNKEIRVTLDPCYTGGSGFDSGGPGLNGGGNGRQLPDNQSSPPPGAHTLPGGSGYSNEYQ